MDDEYAELRAFLEEYDRKRNGANGIADRIKPIVWSQLRDMDFDYDWLVDKWWPVEGHLHLFASPKTGKSLLMLWIAANLAIGRDPFSWEPCVRRVIAYVDNEMTLKDVQERLTDMGFDFEQLEGWLYYFPYPQLAPMDTPSGGSETLDLMLAYKCEGLIIDTLSRVVKGEENSNDTYRNFYNFTGRLLKANAVAMARLDHAGHDPKKSRGASAKADDVDLVYALERRSDSAEHPGYRLTRTHSRIGTVSEFIELELNDDPVWIKSTRLRSWSDAAIRKARELDSIEAPIDGSKREIIALLKAANIGPGKTTILLEAMKLRMARDDHAKFGL